MRHTETEAFRGLSNGLDADNQTDQKGMFALTWAAGKQGGDAFFDLLTTVRELFELDSPKKIYESIATWLNRYLDNSIIIVSSYDNASSLFHIRAAAGIGSYMDRIIYLLGSHPVEQTTPINNAAREGLTSNRLERVAGGIYELSVGAIPQSVCRGIEQILHVTATYAMGLTWREELLGGVNIMVRNNREITDKAVIESFIQYAAIALHSRLAPGA